jgi:hypothetical protein
VILVWVTDDKIVQALHAMLAQERQDHVLDICGSVASVIQQGMTIVGYGSDRQPLPNI